ncbi:Flagellar biosynthesis protein FliQ [Sulfurimonas denitrificans DSM 1251]|uniref:Flagellar biosynthetic protein FliQ n=1 Tax=Sulfurimonas denitrificans (strain ATCC 33889 / DSM 1251) TaxID=326298 RepID=Q30P02_SULDN|nr:flagellar biosynthesis protein FliQ [Sulfurimonas denitrificans]ABB45279.1 Flagellar biosynthesis protein FliQ [Sulfurimonas denitrificans DSM 1251]MDD3442078.1 flagellar biosynthesis protein FliQ [Sulfurimonas denitrificans]
MEAKLITLGIDTFKVALMLALPGLLVGMFIGLAVSIFQATTQINEMTLSFIPKIVGVAIVIILTMPWMLNVMIDFTTEVFNMMPTFVE